MQAVRLEVFREPLEVEDIGRPEPESIAERVNTIHISERKTYMPIPRQKISPRLWKNIHRGFL
jgi:hypothetical protein